MFHRICLQSFNQDILMSLRDVLITDTGENVAKATKCFIVYLSLIPHRGHVTLRQEKKTFKMFTSNPEILIQLNFIIWFRDLTFILRQYRF